MKSFNGSRYFVFGISTFLIVLSSAFVSNSAHAMGKASPKSVQLFNVPTTVSDCPLYVSALELLSTDKVKVQAACTNGSFVGGDGNTYTALLSTSVANSDTQRTWDQTWGDFAADVPLHPVYANPDDCANLQALLADLSSGVQDQPQEVTVGDWTVSITDTDCQKGNFIGPDSKPYGAMIAPSLHFSTNVGPNPGPMPPYVHHPF
jgi:hypothetical protein